MSPYVFKPPKVWAGMFDGVPSELAACLDEAAFDIQNTTFCIWRASDDTSWHHGPVQWPDCPDPDGSAELLSPLDGHPETYQEWAESYYEQAVGFEAVRHVYAQLPLTDAVVRALNPDLSLSLLRKDIEEIGYPI
jgi:hypothetical protein